MHNNTIHILQPDINLIKTEKVILSLELNFIPRSSITKLELYNKLMLNVHKYHRMIALKLYFKDDAKIEDPIPKHNYNPTPFFPPKNTRSMKLVKNYISTCENKIKTYVEQKQISPLTALQKYLAIHIKKLKTRTDIVIRPADKNLGLTVMHTAFYDELCKTFK